MPKGFVARNIAPIKGALRIAFGLVWLIDAYFKLQNGFLRSFSSLIASGAAGQPQWLSGWFSFWISVTSSNPAFWAYAIAIIELALAISLIFGIMRKVGYIGGFFYSLLIWSVPEGFGGPYGPSSTDIGTGIIYAIVFLLLIAVNAMGGPSRYSLDYKIEKRVRWWRKLAEFGKG